MATTLVIFDMDQTLVDFIEVHDRATRELFPFHGNDKKEQFSTFPSPGGRG